MNCKTIICSICGLELEESFFEQKCPRCQSIIQPTVLCGSCHSCNDSPNLENNKKSFTKTLLALFKK